MPNHAIYKNVNLEYILYVVQKITTSQAKFSALIHTQKRRHITRCRITQQRNLHNHQSSKLSQTREFSVRLVLITFKDTRITFISFRSPQVNALLRIM